MDLILRGSVLTTDGLIDNGWIGAKRGKIVAIGTGEAPEAAEAYDAGSSYVLPGVIDGQTHAGSYAGLKGLGSTTRSAVAGGVTTIVDMPYDNPYPLSTTEHLEAKLAAISEHAHANVALYATVMPGQSTAVMQALIDAGVVAFKISAFESSPTRFPRVPAADTLDILEALAPTHIPLGLHNEDQEIVLARIAQARNKGSEGIRAHSDSRPLAAELGASALFLELGASAAAHSHLVHLSSARGFQLVANYQRDGFRATGELCVHYLWFDPAKDGDELGARMKVNPPIRPGQIDALWNEVTSGRVAFVSSDHSSWPIDNKYTDSIFDAGAGVPGLETLLPAFFTGAQKRGLNAVQLTAEQLAERPAKFFGLWPEKGAIRVGADADIVVLSRESSVWHAADAHDELNWSPFEDKKFDCQVSRTYVGGMLAWDGKSIVNSPGDGKFAARGASHWFS